MFKTYPEAFSTVYFFTVLVTVNFFDLLATSIIFVQDQLQSVDFSESHTGHEQKKSALDEYCLPECCEIKVLKISDTTKLRFGPKITLRGITTKNENAM
jgi:hypothetical protein